MDYLKVPELPSRHKLPIVGVGSLHGDYIEDANGLSFPVDDIADLYNAVYTPHTGLLVQIEDQKRVIEELRGRCREYENKLASKAVAKYW